MVKEKIKKRGSVKAPSIQDRTKIFKGNLLRGEYDEDYLKKNGLYERTMKRKMRYWCFKHRHAAVDNKDMPNAPEGLREFVEGLPGFAGWKNFAKSWDMQGTNPFMIVLRLQSVWSEWDNVMNRVAIPIDSPPEQINARIEALTREYLKNN